MPKRRRRREGFDYFVDKYENSYSDDFDDYVEYDDDYRFDNTYIPGNRFQKLNKYTGEIQGKKQFVNTSSIYTGAIPQQGTLEFSAIPGQGGLNPNERPLGDQTLMMSTPIVPETPNPYVNQILQTQQMRFDELAEKVDNLTREIHQSTQTLNLNNKGVAQGKAPVAQKPTSLPSAPVAQKPVPATPISKKVVTTSVKPVNANTSTTVVQKQQATKKKKKKKISTGALVGGIIGIIIALGLITVGVLMIMGIIAF